MVCLPALLMLLLPHGDGALERLSGCLGVQSLPRAWALPAGMDQPAVPRPAAPAAAPPAAGAPAPQQQPAPAVAEEPFDMFGNAPGGGGGGGEQAVGPLAALRASPQFQGLRAVVQQRPELLQPMLAVSYPPRLSCLPSSLAHLSAAANTRLAWFPLSCAATPLAPHRSTTHRTPSASCACAGAWQGEPGHAGGHQRQPGGAGSVLSAAVLVCAWSRVGCLQRPIFVEGSPILLGPPPLPTRRSACVAGCHSAATMHVCVHLPPLAACRGSWR